MNSKLLLSLSFILVFILCGGASESQQTSEQSESNEATQQSAIKLNYFSTPSLQ